MFFDPEQSITRYNHDLPHWDQPGVWTFITWRLGDSLPHELVVKWKAERSDWIAKHPEPWDEALCKEYHDRFSTKIDYWLDQGMGACHLRNPSIAKIVAECLLHDRDKNYLLESFVVMPNHVHVLVRCLNQSLGKMMQTWKSVTSHKINKQLKLEGAFWQARYWDRLIRNEAHFDKVRSYIRDNPKNARLPVGDYILWPE